MISQSVIRVCTHTHTLLIVISNICRDTRAQFKKSNIMILTDDRFPLYIFPILPDRSALFSSSCWLILIFFGISGVNMKAPGATIKMWIDLWIILDEETLTWGTHVNILIYVRDIHSAIRGPWGLECVLETPTVHPNVAKKASEIKQRRV